MHPILTTRIRDKFHSVFLKTMLYQPVLDPCHTHFLLDIINPRKGMFLPSMEGMFFTSILLGIFKRMKYARGMGEAEGGGFDVGAKIETAFWDSFYRYGCCHCFYLLMYRRQEDEQYNPYNLVNYNIVLTHNNSIVRCRSQLLINVIRHLGALWRGDTHFRGQ